MHCYRFAITYSVSICTFLALFVCSGRRRYARCTQSFSFCPSCSSKWQPNDTGRVHRQLGAKRSPAPAIKGPPHCGAVASDRGRHGTRQPSRPHRQRAAGCRHRHHAAPAIQRHRPFAQTTGRCCCVAWDKTGAHFKCPPERPLKSRHGQLGGPNACRSTGNPDRQRSHARAGSQRQSGVDRFGIEIRRARSSPAGRGHAQHTRHESIRQVGAQATLMKKHRSKTPMKGFP